MARKAGGKRFGFSLGAWIFLIVGSIVLLTAGGALLVTQVLGTRIARQSAARALDANHAVRTVIEQQRYRQLQLISRIFSSDRLLSSYLTEAAEARDPEAIRDSLEEYQNRLSFDLAVVLDRNGSVVSRTGDPGAAGEDLSGDPLVATALGEKQAFGVWARGDGLYHAVALPLVRNFERVGLIVVGFSVNDALARQIQRSSGADTVFLINSPTGPAAAASTLAPAAASELVSGLRRRGEVLARVTQRGETADQVEVELQGTGWIAFLAPLLDAAEAPVGAAVAVTSYGPRLADTRLLQLILIGLGGASLALGLLGSQMLSRRTAKPLAQLAEASRGASRGDFSIPLPAGGAGDVGRLRDALGELFGDLAGKQALELFVSRVRRTLPEPAKGAPTPRPQARQATLLAVEMRRFANPKIGHDPQESLARMARDLKRVSTAVEARQGRLESVFGHRVLALFEGEGAAFGALAAAAEALHRLSEREDVFDEPEPPVVALAGGQVVTGSVVWREPPTPAVAGLPVQQLESLLREAAPGEITLSKTVQAELARTLERAGVEARAQRGLLSPQPLFVLSGEAAGRATGFEPAAPAADPGAGRPSLSAVGPGTVLGGRFEVAAQLGVGHMGTIWKARDRELGDLVVLKLLKAEVVADAARFERLRSVMQRSRTLRHPNVVGVLDFAEVDGLPYLASEYVRGLTLRHLLGAGGPMAAGAGFHLATRMARGLEAAHAEGLLHLGVKPENVVVEPQGHARLMDFGLAPPPGSSVAASSVPYLAPEQLEGREGDARTDVWAFGAVLYETFTGRVPYPGQTPAEIRQRHLMEDAAPPGALAEGMPPRLEQVVVRCLAKAAEARYGSFSELLRDLAAVRA